MADDPSTTAAPWFVRAFRWIVGWRERHEAFLDELDRECR